MKVFQKDSKFWSPEQQQEVEKFFLFNHFLSKLYERRIFHKIVELTYYAKIQKGEQLFLNYNKRPEVIILLSGEIQIFKKNVSSPLKKSRSGKNIRMKSPKEQFSSIGVYRKHSETTSMVTQAKIVNVGTSDSEILYIPASLYNSFIEQKRQESLKSIFQILMKKFSKSSKIDVKVLSEACFYKEYTMNSIIFRSGDIADFAYILLDGNVRIDRPDFSQKKQGLIILSPDSMFGESDLQKSSKMRENTALSCCAYSRVLAIPKTAYLSFIESNSALPEIALKMVKHTSNPQKTINSVFKLSEGLSVKKTKLPQLMRFRVSNRTQEEQEEQQYKLIRNSHRLLDAKPRKKSLRSKSALENYNIDPLKQRIMLFEKIRPLKTKVSIANPFFDYKS